MNDRVPRSRPLGQLGDRLDTPAGWEWVRRAAWAVLAAAFLAFIVRGATRPDDPFVAIGNRIPLKGFDEIAFRVTDPKGMMSDWCAMLADTNQQRERGLMGQHDLRGYDGMVFRYQQPVDGSFWMKDTLIPLAIAYFDGTGRFVSAAGMVPCPPQANDCPSYPPAGKFQYALEVPKGGLGRLGVGAGSTIAFPGGPCPT